MRLLRNAVREALEWRGVSYGGGGGDTKAQEARQKIGKTGVKGEGQKGKERKLTDCYQRKVENVLLCSVCGYVPY